MWVIFQHQLHKVMYMLVKNDTSQWDGNDVVHLSNWRQVQHDKLFPLMVSLMARRRASSLLQQSTQFTWSLFNVDETALNEIESRERRRAAVESFTPAGTLTLLGDRGVACSADRWLAGRETERRKREGEKKHSHDHWSDDKSDIAVRKKIFKWTGDDEKRKKKVTGVLLLLSFFASAFVSLEEERRILCFLGILYLIQYFFVSSLTEWVAAFSSFFVSTCLSMSLSSDFGVKFVLFLSSCICLWHSIITHTHWRKRQRELVKEKRRETKTRTCIIITRRSTSNKTQRTRNNREHKREEKRKERDTGQCIHTYTHTNR